MASVNPPTEFFMAATTSFGSAWSRVSMIMRRRSALPAAVALIFPSAACKALANSGLSRMAAYRIDMP